jgi:hypothetical protein
MEGYDYDRAKESMKKGLVKNSTDSVRTSMGNLTALRVSGDGYDIEQLKQKQIYLDEIRVGKLREQQQFLKLIRARFNPLSCI